MEITTTRKLEDGDLALLELATVVDGFWSDRTRVRVAGNASQQKLDVFDAVCSAQEAAIAKIYAGVKSGDVDEAARSIIRNAGYDEFFMHVTGHGLGFRYHEPTPVICPDCELILECGMTHTVEPGVYFVEMGGVRIEENIAVMEDHAEVLGPFKKDLC